MMDERYKEARTSVIGLEASLNEIRDGVPALHQTEGEAAS